MQLKPLPFPVCFPLFHLQYFLGYLQPNLISLSCLQMHMCYLRKYILQSHILTLDLEEI